MADCSYSRCVQERRNIRRELQKWTKNMVYIVGLERIAEELMGRRKWKLYQESMSMRNHNNILNNNFAEKQSATITLKQEVKEEEEEQERLKDWSPQSKCYFCVDGKLDSDHTTHGPMSPRPSESDTSDSPSDSEVPPTLTPSPAAALQLLHHNNNNSKHHSNMTTIENVTSMASLAAVAALSGGGACPGGPQVPFGYPPGLFAPNWPLGLLRSFPQLSQTQQQERLVDPADKVTTDQPLDLSSKSATSNTTTSIENKLTGNMRLPTALDIKHIKAKPRMTPVAGRRTYTEEELQAALRDIQSGKLGTRRAAVIYGIPRSTLRNKVYKLAMERERESHLVPPVPLEDEPMDDEKELSGAEEEKEVEKALQGPLLSMADILRFSSNMDVPDALKTLLLQKAGKDGQDNWAGLEHSAIGPYIQMLLATQQKQSQEHEFPLLPEQMRKMIAEEQHLNNGDSEKNPHLQPSPSNSIKGVKVEPQDMDTEESSSNVILKIPSFKPTSKNGGDNLFTSAVVSPPVTSESSGSPPIMPGNMISLREAIAKSISQKMQQNPEPHKIHPPAVEMDFKRVGFTPPLNTMPIIKNHQEQSQTPQQNRNFQPTMNKQPQQNTNNNNSSTSGGKGTRPKRGKYRNYDRDSLVEAVRAVQRGEMSVHRAGSYYGVPHSTLEYKVKERHLMRPRKRDPKPNPVDEKIASMKSQEISRNNIQDKMKPAIKPPQKFPPTSPNGIKIPPIFDPAMPSLSYSSPPFPFWPHPSFPHIPTIEYPRNPSTSQFSPNPDFYASQMMQRLQEDRVIQTPSAVSGSTNQPAITKMAESLYDGTGANGSFLDGIIRSSLESGVPSQEKSNNLEDKNVTPENMSNKALLDQLCRNSRITPLPKANTSSIEPNSSGDESYKKVTSPLNFANKGSLKDRDSPIALNLGKLDTSPVRYKNENHNEIQTIELSNDSNDSHSNDVRMKEDGDEEKPQPQQKSPQSRIYVKPQFQEITKPENLKPEVLVRFRDNIIQDTQQDIAEHNGIGSEIAIGSASEDMAQD